MKRRGHTTTWEAPALTKEQEAECRLVPRMCGERDTGTYKMFCALPCKVTKDPLGNAILECPRCGEVDFNRTVIADSRAKIGYVK